MLSQITFTTHAKEGLTLEEHIAIGAKKREFSNYQVWGYYSKAHLDFPAQIHYLTSDSFESSIPPNLSLRLRLLLEGYVHENLKAAA